MNIDEIDKMILTLLARNPHLSQAEIAKEVNLTQPSVAARIEKLKTKRILKTQIGINPLELGLFIAKVDVSTTNSTLILEMFKHCPYFINGYRVSGKYNLCLFFISENVKAIEALVDYHLRSLESVKEITFNLIIDAQKNFIVPVKFMHEDIDNSPCSDKNICTDCQYFVAKKCLGCPTSGINKGWES